MKLDKIRFAKVVKFITELQPQHHFELDELDDLISIDIPQPDVAYPSVSDINMLMHLMAAGTQKIEAIKVHRKLTGWGLKESKDLLRRLK